MCVRQTHKRTYTNTTSTSTVCLLKVNVFRCLLLGGLRVELSGRRGRPRLSLFNLFSIKVFFSSTSHNLWKHPTFRLRLSSWIHLLFFKLNGWMNQSENFNAVGCVCAHACVGEGVTGLPKCKFTPCCVRCSVPCKFHHLKSFGWMIADLSASYRNLNRLKKTWMAEYYAIRSADAWPSRAIHTAMMTFAPHTLAWLCEIQAQENLTATLVVLRCWLGIKWPTRDPC